MMLVDSHCHLDHQQFEGELEMILDRARRSGVTNMLTIGTTVAGFPRVLEIAERNEDVFCTIGVHPHEAAAEQAVTVDCLLKLSDSPKVIGLGECGLDYYYNRSPQDAQIATFRTHIAAARESGLPLVVHSRDADDQMVAILEEEQSVGPFTGVLHCFSSGRVLAETAVRLGLYISFSGILTFKKSNSLRDIAAVLPVKRLLIETDAPYLAPVPLRGRRNEPSYVTHTLRALATCRGEDEGELAEVTSANFFQLFRRATRRTGNRPPYRS
jgi:TatD DNase family protein